MELVKSKGFVLFLVVSLFFTIVSSINTKLYDEKIESDNYIAMNVK